MFTLIFSKRPVQINSASFLRHRVPEPLTVLPFHRVHRRRWGANRCNPNVLVPPPSNLLLQKCFKKYHEMIWQTWNDDFSDLILTCFIFSHLCAIVGKLPINPPHQRPRPSSQCWATCHDARRLANHCVHRSDETWESAGSIGKS